MQELESSYNTTSTLAQNGVSASALQIRLETQQIQENIEMFLRGAKLIIEQDEKTLKVRKKIISIGRPKANDFGIQAILSQVSVIINPAVVQGNFATDEGKTSSQFESYIIRVHKNIACNLMLNLYNWEISEEDYDVIVDHLMDLIEPFMTRLIDNKERESYESTIRHVESNTVKDNTNQGWSLFGNR